jgi:ribonuclease R
MSHIPSKTDILAWVRENPEKASKRDISRAFGIKGNARIELKRILREMHADGSLKKTGRKAFRSDGALPPVAMVTVIGPNRDGDLMAEPAQWDDDGPAPRIIVIEKRGDPALGKGDRMLAKMRNVGEEGYEARLIKKIRGGARKSVGVFRAEGGGGRLVPVDRKTDEMIIAAADVMGAKEGELIEVEALPGPRMGLRKAKVVERLGDPSAARSVSLIAIHAHEIPNEFPEDTIAEALGAKPVANMKGREDLRDLPLITIDPADARDHDDAICAAPDEDPKNKGGHVVWVAIADVAHYVTPGSALDREARKRGNSTYFPDRVVPMLPEELSGDLCSLHEGVERPCLAVRMVLGPDGVKRSHSFHRGIMRSPASLTYEQAQAAANGEPDEQSTPIWETMLKPVFAAYTAAAKARDNRAPLNLNLPERRIEIDELGKVTSVNFRDRLDAHRLVEEFMIQANVCAAETLEQKQRPLLYRVHEEPNPLKLDALREQVAESGLTLAKGQVLQTRHLNNLLAAAADTKEAELINLAVLRAQTQAYYSPENFGHFGLALRSYGHFTSPIRRYADLIVHRALVTAHGWGSDGLSPSDEEHLKATAEHISTTERRSMVAERDTTDRYLAAYLADRQGAEFTGRVAGVARFGIFVKLDENGADGLIPVSSLGTEYFRYDETNRRLTGERSGKSISAGARATVRLAEVTPLTGGLLLELIELEGFGKPARGARRSGGARPQQGRAKIKKAKMDKKAKRTR